MTRLTRWSRRVFWGSVGLVVYTYLAFPALSWARATVRPRPYVTADVTPTVTVVVAAHNEAHVIKEKLDNLLELDYPAGLLQVIVVSDGSDDGTDDVVATYGDERIRLLSLPRVGKIRALNAAVPLAEGEILVFSDANVAFDRSALRALVRPFADDTVGGVAGDQRYTAGPRAVGMASSERGYWNLDRMLKEWGSRGGNTIAATGAIYAIRRELFERIPVGVTDDFFVSTGVITRGRRLVFRGEAVAYEPVAPSAGVEYDRKVRIISQGLRSVVERRELLDARRHGFYAIQLLSHKVLRRLMALPLIGVALASPGLWGRARAYRLVGLGQVLFYGVAAVGGRLPVKPALLTFPRYFCMVNAAALRAVVNLATGRRIDRWDPQRDLKQG